MKIIFVDAENVGFKGLESINANIIDKVFVFSRVDSIQKYSEQKLFICLSDYPEGSNQADFYIIGYISRMLASISKAEKNLIEFVLYSSDVNLVNAFRFQCRTVGAKNDIVSFSHEVSVSNVASNISKTPKLPQIENQIFNMLKKPKGLSGIQEALNLSKPIFTKAINELINSNRIKRASNNGKNWVQIKNP